MSNLKDIVTFILILLKIRVSKISSLLLTGNSFMALSVEGLLSGGVWAEMDVT
jgi:hypothetical protein